MKKIFIPFFAAIISLSSCKNFLDINVDPNSPSSENITADMVFSGIEMNLATSYGNFLRTVGGYYAQQYAQTFGTSNYIDYSRFIMSPTRSSSTYTQLNTKVLNNLQEIIKSSEAKEDWGTHLAATVLRVYTLQALVDAYGEIPYSEALDISNVSPKFDEGSAIYDGILEELEYSLSKVSATDRVPLNFLFETSTAQQWIQFANGLKLKLLMRQVEVKDVRAKLAELVAQNNFPTEDVAWDGIWIDELGKANPYYQEEEAKYFGSTQINVVANIAYVNTMQASGDNRLSKFFKPNEDSGIYAGGVSGSNFSTSTAYKASYFSRPVLTYNMPVSLLNISEVEFFLAEYYARYGTATLAEEHYKNAIDASFASANATGAANIYNNAYPWNNNDYKRILGIQKWIALGGFNNFEAWCELRRLKYPQMGTVTGSQIYNDGPASGDFKPELYVPGTLYTPINPNPELGNGRILQRLKYPESSTSRNSNAPALKPDSEPIFWAK